MAYNPKDIYLHRAIDNTAFEEHILVVQPNCVVVTDGANNLLMVPTSSIIGSASVDLTNFTSSNIHVNQGLNANYIRIEDELSVVGNVENGNSCTAINNSHAQGDTTLGIGAYSHAEGVSSVTLGAGSHAEGVNNVAEGNWSHAEGAGTRTIGVASHTEGEGTVASGSYQHVMGRYNAAGNSSSLLIIGNGAGYTERSDLALFNAYGIQFNHPLTCSKISSSYIKITGNETLLETGNLESGNGDTLAAYGSQAQGKFAYAFGAQSHAEGSSVIANANQSHAEGYGNVSDGDVSHAEGFVTHTYGPNSHAEGSLTKTWGENSHAEGYSTNTAGENSHAEGVGTITSGSGAHAEGESTIAIGDYSHTEGLRTIASGSYQHVQGRYNTQENTSALLIIGNGFDSTNRSDLALFNSQSIQFNQPLICNTVVGTASCASTASYMTGSNFRIVGNQLQVYASNNDSWYVLSVIGAVGSGSIQLTPA